MSNKSPAVIRAEVQRPMLRRLVTASEIRHSERERILDRMRDERDAGAFALHALDVADLMQKDGIPDDLDPTELWDVLPEANPYA